ncbi:MULTISPECIES: hypothetical protein [unclassified Vibrio]|uniref:hypothetical protein n=1 Tax=unclassified Vibrio TaxID=2614977 RepID=UPI00354BE584
MKLKYKGLFVLVLSFFYETSLAKDHVESQIVINFDKDNYREAQAVSMISPNQLVQLWGWLRFIPDGKIAPETYYLEWEYQVDGRTENLGNYNTNKKYLHYQRKADREEAFYWVSKRVWSQSKGRYVFRVYVERNGKPQLVSESMVEIGS